MAVERLRDDGALGEYNDVALGGIEHKLGINSSATCTLNFGENDACHGELVGGVAGQGIKQMFHMMCILMDASGKHLDHIVMLVMLLKRLKVLLYINH